MLPEALQQLALVRPVAVMSLLWTRLLQGYLPWTLLMALWTAINTLWLTGLLMSQVRAPAAKGAPRQVALPLTACMPMERGDDRSQPLRPSSRT